MATFREVLRIAQAALSEKPLISEQNTPFPDAVAALHAVPASFSCGKAACRVPASALKLAPVKPAFLLEERPARSELTGRVLSLRLTEWKKAGATPDASEVFGACPTSER